MKGKALLVAALALALASCSGAGSTDATLVEMSDDQRFAPASVTIPEGTTVVFENVSEEAHTVTAYEEALPDEAAYFASGGFSGEEEAREHLSVGLVGREASYEVTFDVPGTYEYFCIPHEDQGMEGTIVVEAE